MFGGVCSPGEKMEVLHNSLCHMLCPVPVCTSEIFKEWGIEENGDMPVRNYFYFHWGQFYTHSAGEDMESPCSRKAIRKTGSGTGNRILGEFPAFLS